MSGRAFYFIGKVDIGVTDQPFGVSIMMFTRNSSNPCDTSFLSVFGVKWERKCTDNDGKTEKTFSIGFTGE